MGLNQAVSTGKPVAKRSYQRQECFLKEEFSHPQRSNKIPDFLQNNPFVDSLSAKLKLIHSEVWWWNEFFFPVWKSCCQQRILLSVLDPDLVAMCLGAGGKGNDLESHRGRGAWQDALLLSLPFLMHGALLDQGNLEGFASLIFCTVSLVL